MSPGDDMPGVPESARPTTPILTGPRSKICRILHAGNRRAVRLAHIGAEEGEVRLAHPLQIDVLAEIELVIAGHEDVRLDHVGQFDDVRALVEARHQRGRERVARMAEQHRHAPRPLGLHDRGQLGEAAAALVVRHLVDVVDQQQAEGDVRRRPPAPPRCCRSMVTERPAPSPSPRV